MQLAVTTAYYWLSVSLLQCVWVICSEWRQSHKYPHKNIYAVHTQNFLNSCVYPTDVTFCSAIKTQTLVQSMPQCPPGPQYVCQYSSTVRGTPHYTLCSCSGKQTVRSWVTWGTVLRVVTWLFKFDIWYNRTIILCKALHLQWLSKPHIWDMQFVSLSAAKCYNLSPSKHCVSPRDLPQFNVMTIPISKNLPTVCNYTAVQTLPQALSMFTVTQLNGTADNNLHSAVPVLLQ